MDNETLRLECLKIAAALPFKNSESEIIVAAEELHQFLIGRTLYERQKEDPQRDLGG